MSIPDDDGNYYSEQCSRCRWGEWRGGCLNPASAKDLSDMDAAYKKGACRVFEAGKPQPDQAPKTLYVQMQKETYDKMIAALKRAEAAEALVTALQSEAEAGVAMVVARAEKAEAALKHADALLSDGLGIVEDLTAGHDVWAGQVRSHLYPGQETSQ
jgi:hypothetical protein